MSASPIARQACTSHSQSIPSKKILVTDSSQLPDVYSSTPGGTLYSTTPGGKLIFINIIKKNKICYGEFIVFGSCFFCLLFINGMGRMPLKQLSTNTYVRAGVNLLLRIAWLSSVD